MNAWWEVLTASISIMELEDGSGGVHTTSTCDNDGGVDDEQDEDERKRKSQSQKDRLPSQHSSPHIIKPALMRCMCDVLQDTLFPCRHACAVYHESKSAGKNYILANLINEYDTFGCFQTTFTKTSSR